MAATDPSVSSSPSRRTPWGLPEWGAIAAIVAVLITAGGMVLKANSDYSVLAADNRRHEGAIATLSEEMKRVGDRATRIEGKLDFVIEAVKGSPR